jgi:transposase InsO family protein/transposase
MPFKNKTVMEQKIEFVLLAENGNGFRFNELCKRFNISRKTGYKWINRYRSMGVEGLREQTRRPIRSPLRFNQQIEEYVIKLRKADPEWGPKKLCRIMHNNKEDRLYPYDTIPCKNTIGKILIRNGLIDPIKSDQSKPFKRFEYGDPNELWQMDFKGYFAMLNRRSCHPLAILDDHSRFSIGLFACHDQRYATVQGYLIDVFRKYGLPGKMLTDNGSPWGTGCQEPKSGPRPFTGLEKWLLRLNVQLVHGRPYHPQTQGKEERFNKTFKNEVLKYNTFKDIGHCQKFLNEWREKYNCHRPHESLNQDVPSKHYTPSPRSYPENLPPVEYDSNVIVRRVEDHGEISFKNTRFRIGKAFINDNVGIKPTDIDGEYEVYFCSQYLRNISLNENSFKKTKN